MAKLVEDVRLQGSHGSKRIGADVQGSDASMLPG